MKTCERCNRSFDPVDLNGACPHCVLSFAVDKSQDASAFPQLPGIKIEALIGKGGMGNVYRGLHVAMGRPVAVKVLSDEVGQDQKFLDRFIQEIRAMAKLHHPNIVIAYDAGVAQDTHYLVMEYVEGRTAEDLLKTQKRVPESVCVSIGRQIASALAHAARHAIVHRDIKPSNILLTPGGLAKLCDLGIAKWKEEKPQSITTTGMTIGTPAYMSPEHIQGAKVDSRSDMYSLGATLFHLATGRPPFVSSDVRGILSQHLTAPVPDPRTLNPSLSVGFSAILRKMLQKTPTNRYRNHEQVVQELSRLERGLPTVSGKSSSRPLYVLGISAVVLLGAIASSAVLFFALVGTGSSSRRNAPQPRPVTPPVVNEPPQQKVEEEPVIDKQIREFRAYVDTLMAAATPSDFSEAYRLLERRLISASEPDQIRWRTEIRSFMNRVNASLDSHWKTFLEEASKSKDPVRFLETWPLGWRYFDSDRTVPTDAERRRLARLKDLRTLQEAGAKGLQTQIEKFIREKKFKEAWESYAALSTTADAARLGERLLREELRSNAPAVPDRKWVERSKAVGREMMARGLDDRLQHVLQAELLNIEKEFKDACAQAAPRYANLVQQTDILFRSDAAQRRYRESRERIGKVLSAVDPLIAALRTEDLAAIGLSLQKPDLSLEELRGLIAQLRSYASPPESRVLLMDALAALYLEALCHLAIEGLGENPKTLKLTHPALAKLERVIVVSKETRPNKPLSVTLRLYPADRQIVVPIAPLEKEALPDSDLVALAKLSKNPSDPILPVAAMLLAHFSNRPEAASQAAWGLTHELVAHFGIQPAEPKAAQPLASAKPKEPAVPPPPQAAAKGRELWNGKDVNDWQCFGVAVPALVGKDLELRTTEQCALVHQDKFSARFARFELVVQVDELYDKDRSSIGLAVYSPTAILNTDVQLVADHHRDVIKFNKFESGKFQHVSRIHTDQTLEKGEYRFELIVDKGDLLFKGAGRELAAPSALPPTGEFRVAVWVQFAKLRLVRLASLDADKKPSGAKSSDRPKPEKESPPAPKQKPDAPVNVEDARKRFETAFQAAMKNPTDAALENFYSLFSDAYKSKVSLDNFRTRLRFLANTSQVDTNGVWQQGRTYRYRYSIKVGQSPVDSEILVEFDEKGKASW